MNAPIPQATAPAEKLKPLPKHPVLPLSLFRTKDVDGNEIFGSMLGGETRLGPSVLVRTPGSVDFVAGPGGNSAPERPDIHIVASAFEVVQAKVSEQAPYHSRLRPSVKFLFENLDELAAMLEEWMERNKAE